MDEKSTSERDELDKRPWRTVAIGIAVGIVLLVVALIVLTLTGPAVGNVGPVILQAL